MDRANDGRRISQKINGEIVVLIGWGPAILLQFAHPLIAAAVAEHSSFRARPTERLRRFRHTLEAMLALTFGNSQEVQRAARGINAIHDRVNGELPVAGGPFPRSTAYSAHDPELLRWVHATMLWTLPRTYELFVGPLTPDEKEAYCAEGRGVEPLLGIPAGYLPTTSAQLADYMTEMLASDEIEVTPIARILARELLASELVRAAGPLVSLNRLATIGLLPPPIRAAYGFPWDRRHQTMLRLAAGGVRQLLPLLPKAMRYWPAARQAKASLGQKVDSRGLPAAA
jgi:uncharacterized protein (DUF2236 family)